MTSGGGVKGLLAKFEDSRGEHGQTPVRKDKQLASQDKTATTQTNKQSNRTSTKSQIGRGPISPVLVKYEGVQLPQDYIAPNGGRYRLKAMPIVISSPPTKPQRIYQDNEDEYGDVVAPAVTSSKSDERGGIRGRNDQSNNAFRNTQTKQDSTYDAYDDIMAGNPSRYSESRESEIYEDISALEPRS